MSLHLAALTAPASDGTVLGGDDKDVVLGEVVAPKEYLGDKFNLISGKVVTLYTTDDGRQTIWDPNKAATPKDYGGPNTSSGTPIIVSGSQEHNSDDETSDEGQTEEFYYCYACKDAWEIDDDDFVDFTCPYCGQTDITIIEMNENDVRDLANDLPFFHM